MRVGSVWFALVVSLAFSAVRDAAAARHIRGLDAGIAKRVFKYTGFDPPRIGKNARFAFRKTVTRLIAQKKMKEPFDPEKHYGPTFIRRTVERHPEWFKDLPEGD